MGTVMGFLIPLTIHNNNDTSYNRIELVARNVLIA